MLFGKEIPQKIAFFMTLVMVLSLGAFTMPAKAQGLMVGDGTPGNPYQITNADQLAKIADTDTYSKNYVLMNDIDLSAYPDWTLIGDGGGSFAGAFDGNGHVIKNLTRSTPIDNMGLFSCIFISGTVKNLSLAGTNVNGDISTGSVAGRSYGLISNCNNSGNIAGTVATGGIVGINFGIVRGCSNSGTVTASDGYTGGITGDNECLVSCCYNTGCITSSQNSVGGIAGLSDDIIGVAQISNCYNTGAVSGSLSVGGIVGMNMENNSRGAIVTNCYNTGIISAQGDCAGMVGTNLGSAQVSYCVSLAENIICNDPSSPSCHRVVGNYTTNLDHNFGYRDMKQNGISVPWDMFIGSNGLDGADLLSSPPPDYYWTYPGMLNYDLGIWLIAGGYPSLKNVTVTAEVPALADLSSGMPPAVQGIRIKNNGNVPATITGVALQDGTNFSINNAGGASVPAGGTDNVTFTISPKANLACGTYTDTVLVTYQDASGTEQTARAPVSFTVTTPVVTSVSVKTAPSKTVYTAGDFLDLSGLVVTLKKSDTTTEEVAFADFISRGITTTPTNGTKLSSGNTSVSITYTAENKSVRQSITVNPAPKPILPVRVSFGSQGGSAVAAQTVLPGSKIAQPQMPKRAGYRFIGWYSDLACINVWNFTTDTVTADTTLYAKWEKDIVGKANIKSLQNPKSKQLTIKLFKISGAKGYEIVYATNSKFSKNKKIIMVTGTNKTIKGLKKGKTYYVKVRAYKTGSTGKKVYGKYSAIKKIKLNK